MLVGQVYGRLTVVRDELVEKVRSDGRVGRLRSCWCHCECGGEKWVVVSDLLRGFVRSCGCLRKEVLIKRSTKHGFCGTRMYSIWCNMIHRATDPTVQNYHGRGISVCEAWRGDGGFARFYACVGEPPSAQHTLERRDNDGNYEPGNVRWATRAEQSRNKQDTVYVSDGTSRRPLVEWAEILRVPASTLYARRHRGWSDEEMLAGRRKYAKRIATPR